MESDGYRNHSASRRDLFNTKLGIQLNEDTRLTVLGTYLDQPLAQDPQGLTKAQWQQNPTQVITSTNTFNTRVQRSQSQAGIKLDHDFDADNSVSLMTYLGTRDNLQYQSIGANTAGTGLSTLTIPSPKVFNSASRTSGGVAQIDRNFGGIDMRYTHKGEFANGPYSFSLGTNFDTMDDHRTGYDNFIALPVAGNLCGVGVICGVKGLLRRDENDMAQDFDQYAQAEWSPQSRWNLVAGVRHSLVQIKSEDHYLSNGNDGGSISFSKTTPVVGAVFKLTPSVNLYANAGKGFETPTLIEMAYAPTNGAFNFNLQPATSNNYEIGAKAFLGDNTRATLAIFKTDTSNEIVVANSFSGRATYQNASGTERNGVELSIDSEFGNGFGGYASYAYLDAQYSDAFCSGAIASGAAVCASKNTATNPTGWVQSGKALPGAYRQTAYAELSWKYALAGFSTALETHVVDKVSVTDKANDTAPGYAIVNWRGGFSQTINHWHIAEFLRLENIFDRNYVGSVKVNDSAFQYYEAGANRNWLIGLNASYSFK
jgi:iron complex outermembrane receptor protein